MRFESTQRFSNKREQVYTVFIFFFFELSSYLLLRWSSVFFFLAITRCGNRDVFSWIFWTFY